MYPNDEKTLRNIIELFPDEGIKELDALLDDNNLSKAKLAELFAKYNIDAEKIKSAFRKAQNEWE